MSNNITDPAIIKLSNVRLSFPHLFKARSMEEGKKATYGAVFLLSSTDHAELIKEIEQKIDRISLDEHKKRVPNLKRCLRDGNEREETEGYGDGIMFLTASSDARPGVVDRMLNPIAEDDGVIYAGCYVNATVRLYAWTHATGGKGVSAHLRAVQFVKDGESFGAGPVDPEKEFEAIGNAGEQKRAPGKVKVDLSGF